MKKILNLTAVLVAIMAIGVITERITFARVTSAAGERDIFCVGPDGYEICVDASSNVIPTTDDRADLGTASLQFQDAYLDGTLYSDGLSVDGASTLTGATALTGAVTIGGQLNLYSRSQAQIEAIIPGVAGAVYYCNDCTATTICVSTSATALSWVSAVAPGTACD